jgi:hypothetical protein
VRGNSDFDYVLRISDICLLASLISARAFACSMASCTSDGAEFRNHFFVTVRHHGKPLPGVRIQITGEAQLELTTGSDGKANISDLRPGNYWLRAEFLGIGAAYQCFHVSLPSSGREKRSVKYEWGDEAVGVNQISGSLIDSQPGTGGHPPWNLTHRVRCQLPTLDSPCRIRLLERGSRPFQTKRACSHSAPFRREPMYSTWSTETLDVILIQRIFCFV